MLCTFILVYTCNKKHFTQAYLGLDFLKLFKIVQNVSKITHIKLQITKNTTHSITLAKFSQLHPNQLSCPSYY